MQSLSKEESHKENKLRISYLTVLGSDMLVIPAKTFFQRYPELETDTGETGE